ncbi:hypothetical protein [Natrinema thermotolerans]|uniref:hypothetical protein n=1 Tax=Natrinema thermotolerans TaxID=121872 RepID=UPI000679C4E3|nr:hypothetical protein [Natrinema thermotolerans]QCC57238.1 hypothetical protein DVR14_00765 [Natrinema thermotolerans]
MKPPHRRENYWRTDYERPQSDPSALEYYVEFVLTIIFRIWWLLAGLGTAYAAKWLFGVGEPAVSIIALSVAAVSFVATLEYVRRV